MVVGAEDFGVRLWPTEKLVNVPIFTRADFGTS